MGLKCVVCLKTRSEEKLIKVYQGRDKRICRKCLEDSDEYDECYMCKSLGRKMAYPIYELIEDDSLKLLCEKHYRTNDNHVLNEDEVSYLEYLNKD